MKDKLCVVEVGIHETPYWKDRLTEIIVCTRHKLQYNSSGLGPFAWEEIKSMNSVIRKVNDKEKQYDCLAFVCPGCIKMVGGSGLHMLAVNTDIKSPSWNWNGNLEKPTLTPSILTGKGSKNICHSYLTDGVFKYLEDCTHEFAGKNIAMLPLPDWFIKET